MNEEKIDIKNIYWIPLIGRLLIYVLNKSSRSEFEKAIILFENTLAYFVCGIYFGIKLNYFIPLFILLLILFLFIIPIEYEVMKRKPKYFLYRGKIFSFKLFFLLMYQAFCYMILGLYLATMRY